MWMSVIEAAEKNGARIGVAAHLPDGSRIGYRENELFKSASTIKIAIMIGLFRQIDAGQRSLADEFIMQESDKGKGSGVLLEMHTPLHLTLRDVLYLMMSISDNTATNILIELVGLNQINAIMQELGMKDSHLGRPMRGTPAVPGEPENLAVPVEFVAMIDAILEGRAASAESCPAMVEMMKLQQNTRRIGRFVPEGTTWGSKTGTVGNLVADAGFIMTQDGPLVVAVYVDDAPDMVAAEVIISEIVKGIATTSLDESR